MTKCLFVLLIALPVVVKSQICRETIIQSRTIINPFKKIEFLQGSEVEVNCQGSSLWHYELGSAFFAAEKYEEAISEFNKCVQHNGKKGDDIYRFNDNVSSEFSELTCKRGIAYFKLNKIQEALIDLKKYVKKSNINPDAFYTLGLIYLELKKYEDAKKNFENTIDIEPGFKDVYCQLGISLFELGNFNESIIQLDKEISHYPRNSKALFQKGLSLVAVGQDSMALATFEAAERIEPASPRHQLAKEKALENILKNQIALPEIFLELPADSFQVSYSELYKIKACITGKDIKSVLIWVNGKEVAESRNFILSQTCSVSIEKPIILTPGDNEVYIAATNIAGTATSIKKTIFFVKPNIYEKKIALVIGNGNYELPFSKLGNAVNDATAVAGKFESLGFKVILVKNASKAELDKSIGEFGRLLKGYEVALAYYAGHGFRPSDGKNYMVPIGANIQYENDIPFQCVEIGQILAKMDGADCKVKILISDACRNDPFARGIYGSGREIIQVKNYGGFQSIGAGTLIAYSAGENEKACDGPPGTHSPYCSSLLKHLDEPNLEIVDLFRNIHHDLKFQENKVLGCPETQTPWEYGSLIGRFYFKH